MLDPTFLNSMDSIGEQMLRSTIIFTSFVLAALPVALVIVRRPDATYTASNTYTKSRNVFREQALDDIRTAAGGNFSTAHLMPDVYNQILRRIQSNGKLYNQLIQEWYFSSEFSASTRAHFYIPETLEITAQTDAPGSLILVKKLKSEVAASLFVYDKIKDKDKLSKLLTIKGRSALGRLGESREKLPITIASLEKKVPVELAKDEEDQPTAVKLQSAAQPLQNSSLEALQKSKEQLDLGLTVYDLVNDKEKLLQLINAEDKTMVRNLARRRQELTSEIKVKKALM